MFTFDILLYMINYFVSLLLIFNIKCKEHY